MLRLYQHVRHTCIDTDAEANPSGDAATVLGLLHSIASVLFGVKMMLCALQLWLADTPSAHNSSYNVCNGERPKDCRIKSPSKPCFILQDRPAGGKGFCAGSRVYAPY